jgi:hypothetical protein
MTRTAPRARTARSIASLVTLALVSACNPAQPPAGDSNEVAREAAPSGGVAADATGDSAGEATGVPVIASDEDTFDFGTITPDGSVEHVFKLVNRGTADLHIERVERT